jgi:hypothetical protein
MSRHEMFGGMDPYDLLITMQDRMNVLEQAHNSLANVYQKINNDVSVLLVSVQTLQRGHLNHSEQLRNIGLVLENLNTNIQMWREELQNKP